MVTTTRFFGVELKILRTRRIMDFSRLLLFPFSFFFLFSIFFGLVGIPGGVCLVAKKTEIKFGNSDS